MSFDQSFLAPAATAYLERLLPAPEPRAVFERIEQEARDEGQPAVGRATGSLLRTLVATHGIRHVLELGCNLGYSALWMATALPPDGHLDTIEYDTEFAQRATGHFRSAGVGERTTVHVGEALMILPNLPDKSYDLMFLDAAKFEYPQYLDHALRLLRPGGVLAADNLLWLGQVWDEKAQDDDTNGVREYTRRIFSDPRFVSTLVPVEDGLGLSVFRG